MQVTVLGDFAFVQNLESVALEKFRAASILENDNLAVNPLFAIGAKVLEVSLRERARARELSGIRQHIEMEMRRAARGRGHFAPCMDQDPADEFFRRLVIPRTAICAPGQQAQV